MSARKFLITCREQGMQLSLDEAESMRSDWISAFSEMQYHMNPEPLRDVKPIRAWYGAGDDEEEEEEDEAQDGRPKRLYRSTLVNGMVRNRCSYCAALNFQFQGLAAYGAKLAMWNLAKYGLLPRLVNFVHDEVLYCLYPDEFDVHVPEIEKLMIAGMRIATPHVKVGVETSVMTHWDKGAVEFVKLEKDDSGRYIIEQPAFVKEVYDGTAQLGV